MKKISIYCFSLAAIVAGGFASCQDYDPFDEEVIREAAVLKEFTKNFEARYGKIDPNHTWGFQDIVITEGADVAQGTRAGSGAAAGLVDPTIPSQRHWEEFYGVVPPGAPDNWNTNSPFGQDWGGAVTAEEILYVSEYFRTHTYADMVPDMVQLHLTDFFVESVSGDYDQDHYLGNHGDGTPIYEQEGVDATITYGMDCLIAKTMDSTNDYNTWHHINNFNYSSTVNRPQQYADNNVNPYLPKDDAGYVALGLVNPGGSDVDDDKYGATKSQDRNRTLMYVRSSGTESFAYHPSWDENSAFYESYVLVHLSFTVNGHHYEGNYLAFDWQGTNGGQHAQPDGYYNNWIIKITPAHYVPSQKFPVSRIMCEDLGNTFDFDFNDLVFDVKYEAVYTDGIPTKVEAILIVQASGGTLPIYLGKKESNYETHFLLGNDTSTPVNVGGESHEPAIIRFTLNYQTDWTYTGEAHNTKIVVNPNNIPIYVGTNSASLVNATTLLPAAGGTAGQRAPQKISIPYTSTRWLKESQQIEWGYGYFDEWVKNQKAGHDYYLWEPDGTGYKETYPGSGVYFRNTEAWTEIHKSPSSDPNNVGSTEESHLY